MDSNNFSLQTINIVNFRQSQQPLWLILALESPLKLATVSSITSLIFVLPIAYYFSNTIPYYIYGIVLGYLFTCTYISTHLRLNFQKALSQRNIQLEKLIKETRQANRLHYSRNQELTQLLGDLEQKNDELKAFARTVAHDLKNPMMVSLTYNNQIVEHANRSSSEKLARMANNALSSGRRTVHIVDTLLLLAQVETDKVPNCESLMMADIVEEAQSRLAVQFDELNASILVPQQWPTAKGYAPWIEVVWSNLLSNALKYGGRPPRVELGADLQPEGMIRFWVADNGDGMDGDGMDAETRKLVFQEFYRHRKYNIDGYEVEGHGLGLSICKRIVERLGGEIGIEPVESGGKFYFTLPAVIDG